MDWFKGRVQVQTFRRRPFVPSHNFCHPAKEKSCSRRLPTIQKPQVLPFVALEGFGLRMTPPPLEVVQKFIRFGTLTRPVELDIRVVTLVRALNPWVSCAFGNVFHHRKKRCCVREKILLGQNASNLSKCYVIFVKIGKNISLMFQIHLGMFDLIFFSQIFPQVLFSFPSSKSFFVHFLTLNAFISSSYVTTTRSTLMNFNLNLKPLVGAAIYCFMKS